MSGPPYEQASGMPECDVKHPLGMNNISIINSKYVIPFSVIINPSLGRDTRVENRGHRLSSSCVQFFFAFHLFRKMVKYGLSIFGPSFKSRCM